MNNEQGRINFGMGLDTNTLSQDAAHARELLHGIGQTATREGNNIDGVMRKVGLAIAGAFTVQQAMEFGRSIVAVRKEIESLEVSFTTLLGSKAKADQLFGQIRQFAVSTPMQLKDLAGGAQTLLSFNYEADKVMGTLKALGDISMGDSQKFNSLTLAFAQMSATGKLMGQDLLQMINAGFNPLSEISRKTGKSIGDLKEEMSKGSISAQMVEEAFISATSAGGKFYGMLEAQSHTITGALSNLQGAIDDMFNDLGQAGQGAFTGAIEGATELVKHYKEVGEAIGVLVGIYGTYKAALAATAAIETAMSAVRYKEEAAALEALMTAEQRAKVSKLGLAASSAEYHAALTAELTAEMERQTAIAQSAQADLTAANQRLALAEADKVAAAEKVAAKQAELAAVIQEATAEQAAAKAKEMALEREAQSRAALLAVKLQEQRNSLITEARALKEAGAEAKVMEAKQKQIATVTQKLAAAKAEEVQHSRNVVALRKELAAQVEVTASKKIAKAETALATAEEELNTAAVARNTAAREVSSKKVIVNTAVKKANAIETGMDTAAETANASATGILALAKDKLTAAVSRLNTAILKNPYVLAAAAIVTLTYALYKLTTYETEAEKATKRLNEATQEMDKSIASERAQIDTMFARLRTAKKGTDEYKNAKEAIISQYGLYLNGMSQEIRTLQNLEGAYRAVAAAARDAARARAMEAFMKSSADNYAKVEGEKKEEILKALKEHYKGKTGKDGRSLAEDAYWKIVRSIEDGTQLDPQWLKQFEDPTWLNKHNNPVKKALTAIGVARGDYNNIMKDAELKFGAPPKQEGKKDEPKVTKNKKYWEDQKNDLQAQLDALSDAEAKGKKGQKLVAQINNINKTLEFYNPARLQSQANAASSKAAKDAKKNAKDMQEYKKQLAEYLLMLAEVANEQERASRQMELDTRQAEIDSEKDGTKKLLLQYKLDYDKQKETIENGYAELKQAKIENAKKLFEANPANKGKIFDPASVDTSYTEAETKWYETQLKAAKKAYDDNMDSILQAQRYSMQEYLKEYGSYEEKRLAIKQEYDEKYKKAQNEGERLQIKAQKEKALQDLDYSKWKQDVDWELIFGDLENVSQKSLETIQGQLQRMLNSDSLDPENAKELVNALQRVRTAIIALHEEESFWPISKLKAEKEQMQKHLEDLNKAADAAQKRADEAKANRETAEKSVASTQSNITEMIAAQLEDNLYQQAQAMGMAGQTAADWVAQQLEARLAEINLDDETALTALADSIGIVGDEAERLTALFKSLAEAQQDVKEASTKEKKANEDAVQAKNKANKQQEKIDEKNKKPWHVKAQEAAEDMKPFFDKVAQYAQGASDLVNQIGLGNTKAGEKVGQAAAAANDAAGAVADFASGNYIGAVVKGISAIQNVGRVFGIGGGNEAEVAETTERLTKSNEQLNNSIDKLKESIDRSNGAQAIESAAKAKKNQEAVQKNTSEILQAQMGYHSAHHSNAYYWSLNNTDYQSLNKTLMEYAKEFNTQANKVYSLEDIYKLTPEEMDYIRTNNLEMWNKMLEQGKYDKSEYWEQYADLAGKMGEIENALRENLTQISFDGLRDSFVDSLMDMDKKASDFSKDFQQYLMKSILNAKIGDMLDEDLEAFYKKWANYSKSGNELTKWEQDELTKEWDAIVEKGLKLRDEVASFTGYDKAAFQQDGSKGGFQAMSQDTGDELNGRFTALQINSESIKESALQIRGTMEELRNISLQSMSYLEDIEKNTRELYAMNEKLDKISRNTQNL